MNLFDAEVRDQSVTKQEKKRRKRKRDRESGGAEEDDQVKRSRQKVREHSNEDYAQPNTNDLDGGISSHYAIGQTAIRGDSKATQSTSSQIPAKSSLSLQRLTSNNPPTTSTNPNEAKDDAELRATLKSFWEILPKALLHTTMTKLNKANRRELGVKLKLCQHGKQTNSNIRAVTRRNEHGEEVDLLEEYGVISEPDPHTMSSDLTLVTAAKTLIVLLSGQRVGLDLSAIVAQALDGKGNLNVKGSGLKLAKQDHVGSVSVLEEQLQRIASERQREVERLRAENRALQAKLKKSKR